MDKHEKTFVDFDQPYEQNIIGLRGIIYFGLGLFLLIVITFALMWVLQYQVFQPSFEAEDRLNENPLALTADERLPPEPRLQSAPGFGVDSPEGERINLERREPQAEYRVLKQQWDDLMENGRKDPKTGTVVAMPIAEAKEKFLQEQAAKANNEQAEKTFNDSRMMYSQSSAGRMASERRR